MEGHEIKELIVPESFLNETVRQYFYHEDTLKYPEGGYSFSRITCTQLLIGLFSIVLQALPSKINIEYEECKDFKGNLMPLCILIILVDIAKIYIFNKALESKFKGVSFKIYKMEKIVDLTVKNCIFIFLSINLLLMLTVYGVV